MVSTKKVLKSIGIILLALILCVVILFGWLSFTEFNPAEVEEVTAQTNDNAKALQIGNTISVLSWNVGYAGLGKDSEFFMDGGSDVKSADKETVDSYLEGIRSTAFEGDAFANIYLFQEVDKDSSRTYHVDETEALAGASNTYALNYSCGFVPYPVPPIGKVNSGLLTASDFSIEKADRIALPCPFKWPVRIANLKRCLLANYIPIEGTDKYLVVVNLHLEAYDDGNGKIAQTNQLKEFIQSEYEKGNYVIAGGDFNQEFPGALDQYPNTHPDLWSPGVLDESMIPEGWTYAYDLNTPSCRLLNQPYNPEDTENTQYYVIDGFIVSPNLTVNGVRTIPVDFANSDHNPVRVSITIQ